MLFQTESQIQNRKLRNANRTENKRSVTKNVAVRPYVIVKGHNSVETEREREREKKKKAINLR